MSRRSRSSSRSSHHSSRIDHPPSDDDELPQNPNPLSEKRPGRVPEWGPVVMGKTSVPINMPNIVFQIGFDDESTLNPQAPVFAGSLGGRHVPRSALTAMYDKAVAMDEEYAKEMLEDHERLASSAKPKLLRQHGHALTNPYGVFDSKPKSPSEVAPPPPAAPHAPPVPAENPPKQSTFGTRETVHHEEFSESHAAEESSKAKSEKAQRMKKIVTSEVVPIEPGESVPPGTEVVTAESAGKAAGGAEPFGMPSNA